MRKISRREQEPIKQIDSSHIIPVRENSGAGSIVDATRRGMICEICGNTTHRMVWKNQLFHCKECYDASIIRKRQNEIARGWD